MSKKTVLTFTVKVDVSYDTKHALNEAIKDIRESLHVECMSFGMDGYNIKSRNVRLVKE